MIYQSMTDVSILQSCLALDTLNFEVTWWTRKRAMIMTWNNIWRSIPIFLDMVFHKTFAKHFCLKIWILIWQLFQPSVPWAHLGLSKSRCFRQDVISLFFPTPDCLSFKLSVLFCFSKRFFYLCWLSISQNYTPGQKKIYTLCYLRFCLYLRILKIRLIPLRGNDKQTSIRGHRAY